MISHNIGKQLYMQDKLYGELRRVVGEDGRLTVGHLKDLKYLKACVQENLRLNPIAFGLGN